MNCTRWQSLENYEVSQTYRSITPWLASGGISARGIGLHGGRLLYWLHFFNVVQIITLVWLAGFVARTVFPENRFIQIAVPALMAFMPQTAFYSIGNDELPALVLASPLSVF